MIRSLALLLVTLAIAPACSSKKAQAQTAEPDLCTQVFVRARACTDQYIPALVDLRARLDHPTGIAAEVAKDRDGVITAAKAEWATDSTDSGIAATCASTPAMLDDQATARGCLAKTDCGEFSACLMPLFEKHFRK